MTISGGRAYRAPVNPDHSLGTPSESLPFLLHQDRDVEIGDLGSGEGSGVYNDKFVESTTIETLDEDLEQHLSTPPAYSRGPARWGIDVFSGSLIGNLSAYRGGWFGRRSSSVRRTGKRPSVLRRIFRLFMFSLMFLGFIQFLGLILGLITAFFPEEVDRTFGSRRGHHGADDLSHWPTDSTADLLPVKCHSHNDYWRKIPLKSAIRAGCTGVEADVWLYGDELYVGHSEASLTPNRTLSSLYVDPLLDLLARQNPITDLHPHLDNPSNGVFDTDASQSLVLLIDFKTNGELLWPAVSSHLEPLRRQQYLTYFDGSSLIQGPITVVVTGNAPFDKVVANTTYRDMFFDAPLGAMASLASNPPAALPLKYDPTEEKVYLTAVASSDSTSNTGDKGQGHSGLTPSTPKIYSPFNSYYASTSFKSSVGIPFPYITPSQRLKIDAQIKGAHSLGLQVRYWSVPAWPISWRNYLWRELEVMGIDYLNVDDLRSATQGRWRNRGGIVASLFWGRNDW